MSDGMDSYPDLNRRFGIRDVATICKWVADDHDGDRIQYLYSHIFSQDELTASNALWVYTHLPEETIAWLQSRQDELIDLALTTQSVRIRRLSMNILERLDFTQDMIRGDFLDFCLDRINSCDAYAVRALSMKLAYKQCRFYPELIQELNTRLNLLSDDELSPGLRSARHKILKCLKSLRIK